MRLLFVGGFGCEQTAVPGGALAVNRTEFSDTITQKIKDPLFRYKPRDNGISKENTVIATALSQQPPLKRHSRALYSFYDAAAPIVTGGEFKQRHCV